MVNQDHQMWHKQKITYLTKLKENCGNADLKDLPPESLKPPFETKCDQELVDMLRNMQILVSGLH